MAGGPVDAPARRRLSCPACAARRAAGLPALERTLGVEVIDWLEAMLVHGPGDVQGDPYRLDDELKHVLLHLYEIDAHGRRVVRRGFLSRPKGRSKTELAGAVSAAELCGPVRYDGTDSRGQPVGRPVKGAQVVAYATEEGQAGTTYSTAAFMLGEGPAVNEYGLDVGLSRTYLEGGGVMLAETSGATSAEGGRTTFAVFDETAYWATRELRRLHATVRRNLGKRAIAEAWSFETSAAWQPGEESVAEVLYRHWTALVESGAVDPTIYVDHREAPEVPDLDDDEHLEAALRHVYGPAAQWLDLPRIMAEIRDPQSDPKEARRFWLNQPMIAADAWLEPELVTARRRTGTLEAGAAITLGFDGSLSDDATALVACTLGPDPRLVTLGVWEAPLAAGPAERAGWVVDVDGVDAAVADAFEDHIVVLMYCDPAYWTPHIAAWAARYGGEVVREFSTARDGRIVPAAVAAHTALTTGELEHDGDPVLERHLRNARTRSTRYGLTLRKDRPKSPNKIDAAMAGVLAFQARIDAIAGGLEQRARRRGGTLITF
jgi:phage terminase large subunit-like protein